MLDSILPPFAWYANPGAAAVLKNELWVSITDTNRRGDFSCWKDWPFFVEAVECFSDE